MARDFRVTDFFRNQHQSLIVDNIELRRDRRVLDVGSNLGQWSTLCCLNGAHHVTGVEPRRRYVDGLNAFAGDESLPMDAVQGIHRDCEHMDRRYDTVILSALVSQMPDVWDFFKGLRRITRHVIIGHHITKTDLPVDACVLAPQYNLTNRNAVDLRDRSYLDNSEGVQYDWRRIQDPHAPGRAFHWYYGIGFLRTLVRHLGYDVVRERRHDNAELFGHTLGADPSQCLWDLVLRVRQ